MDSLMLLTGGSVGLLVLGMVFALIPFFIAMNRNHKYKWIIFVLCLFTMSGIAWVVALVWSLWPQSDLSGVSVVVSHTAGQTSIAQESELTENSFDGDPNLNNDSYKLYLVEKYNIKKNDVLGKYVYDNQLFDTVDLALEFVSLKELNQKVIPNNSHDSTSLKKCSKCNTAVNVRDSFCSECGQAL